MPNDTVTLTLHGDPTLADLTEALDGLRDLLSGLAQAVGHGERVDWLVDGLERSSASFTWLGQAENPQTVQNLVTAYLDVGQRLHDGQLPFPEMPVIATATSRMLGILNGRVASITFETAVDDVTISTPTPAGPLAEAAPRRRMQPAYGAVLGRVQTVSSRGSLRFTLYDLLHNKAVSCYLQEGQHDQMRDAWDRVALVRGLVKRDPQTGRPTSIRRVRSVELRREGTPDGWQRAVGIWSSEREAEAAGAVIRRLRDAQ